MVSPPPVGEKLAIAGHVWRVLDIDHKRYSIYVEKVRGSVPAYFGECAGNLHNKISERMKQVLKEERSYPYLMKNAVARLAQARKTAINSGAAGKVLINLGGNMWCLIPWLGTYAFLALERFLKIRCRHRLGLKSFDSVRPYYMQFTMKVSEAEFFRILFDELSKPLNPMEFLYPKEFPVFDKYDEYLPFELLRKGFAFGVLDIEGMCNCIAEWKKLYSGEK